jgi:hypothetical protein
VLSVATQVHVLLPVEKSVVAVFAPTESLYTVL